MPKGRVKATVPDPAFTESENEKEATMMEWMLAKADDMFVKNIPLESIRDLQPRFMYIFGSLAYALSISCFIYFIYTGYINALEKAFISLDKQEGTCENVIKPITGSYIGAHTGYWNGNPKFHYAEGKYRIEYQNYESNINDYHKTMSIVHDELTVIGEKAESQDLMLNLLYWMTWQTRLKTPSVNLFTMMGSPIYIFDREYVFGVLASEFGECKAGAITSFDQANAELEMSYSYTRFMGDKSCELVLPEILGYDSQYDADVFDIQVDVRAAIVASSVNLGISKYDDLEEVSGASGYITITTPLITTSIRVSQRYHPRYPGMRPIYCVDMTTSNLTAANFTIGNTQQYMCFLKMGYTYGLPLLNHFGADFYAPSFCDCESGLGHAPYCDIFDFMVGVVFYYADPNLGAETSLSLSMLALLELLSVRPYVETNRMSYNASYAACMYDVTTDYYNASFRHAAYEFCNFMSYANCTLMNFNTYDSQSQMVSEFYYQVRNGSCSDSFTTPNWEMLQTTPPTSLTQDYFECTATWYEAIFISVGVASGNTATLIPVVMFSLLPLLYLYLQASGSVPPKDEYSKTESLAILMLRIRDGKTRGINQKGLLKQLTKELITSAKVDGGYPDSDDDSDDEDTTRESVSKHAAHAGASNGMLRSNVFIASKEPKPSHAPTPTKHNASSNSTGFWSNLFGSSEPAPDDIATESISPLSERAGSMGGGRDVEMRSVRYRKSDVKQGVLNVLSTSPATDLAPITLSNAMETIGNMKNAMLKAVDVRGIDGGHAVFRTAEKKTYQLTMLHISELVSAYEGGNSQVHDIYLALYNLLLQHASLALQCSMEEVLNNFTTKASYNIGGRVYCASELLQLSQGAHPLKLGVDAKSLQGWY